MIAAVSSTANAHFDSNVQSAAEAAQNSFYSIGLYGNGVDENTFNLVKNALTKDGYSLIDVQLIPGARPDWFALRPTVLYYDDNAIETAQQIAAKLSAYTKRPFTVQRGAGFGVPKEAYQRSLRIHVVE